VLPVQSAGISHEALVAAPSVIFVIAVELPYPTIADAEV